MAKRTRNHILEDESRSFFKKSLPEIWVCRDKTDDYGIDCEVEIFDKNGYSTGLVFWVQLKGTDEKEDKLIKKINFKKDKINQFISYDIPVLIVRYSSYKNNQYLKWAKSIALNKKATKSFDVKFYESELWSERTNDNIKSYLENQNFIKRGLVKFPIKTSISRAENDNIEEIPFSNIATIKQCLSTQIKYINLISDTKKSILQIKVSKNSIITSFSDLALASMSLTFDKIENEHIENLTKYILITVSQTLYDIGKNNLAEEIIFNNDLLSIIFNYKDYLLSLLPNLLNGDNSLEVLELLNDYFKQSTDDNIVAITTQIILLVNKSENSSATEEFLKTQLDIARKRKNNIGIATNLYNLGNFYRNQNELEIALKYYLEARKFNENYKNKSYYYYELAGVLFLLNKFYFSSKFYAKSIQLKTDYPYAKALWAHSILYLGQYESSLNMFDAFLKEHKNNENIDLEIWQLWYSCLRTFLEHGYSKHQIRDTKTSDEYVEKLEFNKAIEFDFLNALAWFNLGIQNADKEENLSAFLDFTFAALLVNNDIEAWVNATLLGLNLIQEKEELTTLLIFVVKVAYHHNGFEYINHLQNNIKKQNSENVSLILELIDKTISERKKEPIIVRIFNDDDDYEHIEI